jgi:hypothetical protein
LCGCSMYMVGNEYIHMYVTDITIVKSTLYVNRLTTQLYPLV